MNDRHSFHSAVYKILRVIVAPILKPIWRYHCDKVDPNIGPYIVLSNHVTNLDPLFVSLAFPQQMYFVSTEQIFRLGLLSKIINYLVAPIMRLKARTESRTAIEILRRLRSGANVCMFAEGSCTWNGETCPLPSATGKLIKKSGVGLVTYRLEGGYLARPRWSVERRRGPITGHCVHVYSAADLEAMTLDEITEAIRGDLYYNACADGRPSVPYHSKSPAEHLELALAVCPACHGLSTLHSHGDEVFCSCGLRVKYTDYGRFLLPSGNAFMFKTVLDWDIWQKQYLAEHSEELAQSKSVLVFDNDVQLIRFEPAGKSETIITGTLKLFSDRLVVSGQKEITFPLADITDIAASKNSRLSISTRDNEFYEFRSKNLFSALKYILICSNITDAHTLS